MHFFRVSEEKPSKTLKSLEGVEADYGDYGRFRCASMCFKWIQWKATHVLPAKITQHGIHRGVAFRQIRCSVKSGRSSRHCKDCCVCVLDMRYRYDYILYIDYIVYIDYILYNIYYICDLLNWWTILSIFRDIILYNYFLRVKLVSNKIGKIGGIIIGRCVRKVREGCIIIPMTDPWCWYIMFFYANMNGVFVDIHGAPYIAAPLGSVMGSGYWWSAIWRWRREASAIGDHHAALWEPQLDGGRGAGTALYTWLPRYDQFSSAPYII